MSQIYVSGPWSFASGVLQVVESIKTQSKGDKVVYSEKGTEYQFSKLEQSDYVVFVLDGFAWQQRLESISKGMLSELIWCINHRVPMFLAYKSANGLGIYATEIDDNLTFKGIAGTANTFYQIINNQFGTIVAPNDTSGFALSYQDADLGSDCVYLKGEWIADPLDFLNVEQPKSYFY
jgi:hypothetical protein